MGRKKASPTGSFVNAFEGTPPWEIGRAQEDVIRLEGRSGFKGTVLVIACGTGDNALFLASKEHEVLGIDRHAPAIEKAIAKAEVQKATKCTFAVGDALDLGKLKKQFETVLDCGFFHILTDEGREQYAKSLAKAVKNRGHLHILCYSTDEPGSDGPRRVGERELIDLLNMRGWLVEEISEARFETTTHPEGARAWLATFTRQRGSE